MNFLAINEAIGANTLSRYRKFPFCWKVKP